MPPLHKHELLDRVVRAVDECGWNVLHLDCERHPFYLRVYSGEEGYRIRVYIWNLTHGGGKARPKGEYRIQITGVDRFVETPDAKTLILGWWESVGVFAGFDVRKHRGVLGKSPSIQIRETSLHKAYEHGFSPCDKGNQEIAIAFRPDFFVEYVRHLESLHDLGQSPSDLDILDTVSRNPEINDQDITIADPTRKTAVLSVRKRLRDASFRARVLTAYGFQCAVCSIQLKLVEAAHILPVQHESSTDETCNGLALCALHHRAYDQALITITEDYTVLWSRERVAYLKHIKQAEGWDIFIKNLRPIIVLPPAVSDRPHVEYIRMANQVRGWKP